MSDPRPAPEPTPDPGPDAGRPLGSSAEGDASAGPVTPYDGSPAERTPDPTADPGTAPGVDGPAPDAAFVDPTDEHRAVTEAEIDQAAALIGGRAEHLVEDLMEVELETGRREETVEAVQRHLLVRVVRVGAGIIVLILGIALLAAPGPGVVVIALGLGLLAQDVPFARRLLERVRRRLPQDADGNLPRSTIIMMVVVGVGAVALSIGFTIYRLQS